METEKALARLGEMGIERAEVFLNSPSEGEIPFAELLRAIADESGMKITAVHPYSSDGEGVAFFGSYPRRFADGLAEYRKMFEACRILGARYLVFHGAKKLMHVSEELYYERYERLMREGERYGVRVCQENVARCLSNDIGFLRRMREAIPDVAFNLDVKQALRSGALISDVIDAMGENIERVHISDSRADCDCLPPGMGKTDYPALLKRLSDKGFDGELMIELYRWNFDSEEDILAGARFLEGVVTKQRV